MLLLHYVWELIPIHYLTYGSTSRGGVTRQLNHYHYE